MTLLASFFLPSHLSLTCTRTAPSVPTVYDYLCEAGNVGGYDTMVKGGPAPQSRLIAVGDSPMVALYKISKVFAFPSFYCLTRS